MQTRSNPNEATAGVLSIFREESDGLFAEMATGPAMWNGRAVLVTLSDESETGFLNVLKQPGGRKKPFYVKFTPDGEKRQRMLHGSGSATAWEAACKYGYYLATKTELPETEPRKPRRPSEVSSVCTLLSLL